MKKTVVLLSSMLMLSGCASTQHFNADYDRNSRISDEYDISGSIEKHINPGFFSADIENDLVLYINDELVIKSPLHRDESGELQGIYQSKVVTLDCNKEHIFTTTKCVVHIDKKRIGKLTFELSR